MDENITIKNCTVSHGRRKNINVQGVDEGNKWVDNLTIENVTSIYSGMLAENNVGRAECNWPGNISLKGVRDCTITNCRIYFLITRSYIIIARLPWYWA